MVSKQDYFGGLFEPYKPRVFGVDITVPYLCLFVIRIYGFVDLSHKAADKD